MNTTDREHVTKEATEKVLTKTAYEHLVAAVGKMLEEGGGNQASKRTFYSPEINLSLKKVKGD